MYFAQNSTKFIIGILTFLLLLCVLASTAFAENLSIRTGEHDKYSRIVFEWKEAFTYTMKKSSETQLNLKFSKAAQVDVSHLNAHADSNILKVSITEQSPLTLSISIPEGSKYRALKAGGKKLILDIYSPKSGKPQRNKEKKTQEKTAYSTKKPVHASPPSQKHLKSADNAASEKLSAQLPKEAHVDAMPRSIPEKTPKKIHEPLKPLQKIGKLMDTNMITVSATKSMGMSVFENNGYLWLIVDKEDLFVRPQAAGTKADILSKAEKFEIKGGQAFRIKLPGQSNITIDGSGLLWRIKLSPLHDGAEARAKNKPALPKNIAGMGAHSGGGKVFWPIIGALSIMDVIDPRTGEPLKTVSVREARSFAGAPRHFVEFDVLESYAGITIRPKVDDLQVTIVRGGLEITRPGGLHLLPQEKIATAIPYKSPKGESGTKKRKIIYHFAEWEMGGTKNLDESRSATLAALPGMGEGAKLEKLITLGKMYLANGLGAEALGFFNFAQIEMPELGQNPGFLAMRGAAKILNWESEDGFNDLLASGLAEYDDVSYWKAFALADLSDWTQAGDVMPEDIKPIYGYPDALRNRLALGLAEVALRDGNLDQAQEFLDLVAESEESLLLPQKSAFKYLKGEFERQQGNVEKTYEYWEALIEGDDDLYRAKAGLAHTRLKIDENKLDPDKAIDTLERLRYSWRGDELETQVNYWLGRTYFEGDSFLKGLRIMRDSASIAPTPQYARDITEEMGEVFSNLYLGDKLNQISALDAVALYEQFSELVPSGQRGDDIIENLSHYLVNANLLTRAGSLLEHQIDHRLNDEESVRVGIRLAFIRLLDDNQKRALKTLDIVEHKLSTLAEDYPKEEVALDIIMLRIQALSEMDQPDKALGLLEMLNHTPEVNRLRADVAWNARYWDDAADALKDVITDEKISLTRPLTKDQSTLLLNRSIALNLDGDRIAISNIREKYTDLMEQTEKARLFEVITRARQNAQLADRETLLSSISEVDLFKGFMESYRKMLKTEED